MAAALQQPLNEEEIKIPSGNCQGLSREVKFGGILWVSDSTVIPPDLLRITEELQIPKSRKELQQLMRTLR